ncbi:RING finger and transmembrane domain-containing protein 2-like isoform X2 [Limulus polyphemus]|uniref:RING finger and transmembrane domain-containing protein 2-like isoform X2 n=1 Tax=Limulus polyphemus TaxID=6850 RepID=A0ABM1BJT2_LIMPO|nr:RING finger and transmembrane domain-containing protein 2-like isoform X2 [Limulus polyphemus]
MAEHEESRSHDGPGHRIFPFGRGRPSFHFHWSLGPSQLHNITNSSSWSISDDIRHVIRGINPLAEEPASSERGSGPGISSWLQTTITEPSPVSTATAGITSTAEGARDFVIDMSGMGHRQREPHPRNISASGGVGTPTTSTSDENRNNSGNGGPSVGRPVEDASELLRNNPEIRALLSLAEKYVPFLLILLMKMVFDHRIGILVVIGLFVTFCYANAVVKREVGKQNKRQLFNLLIVVLNIVTCTAFVYLVFDDSHLAFALVFVPPYSRPVTVWEVLWLVTVTDFVLKLANILCKTLVLALPAKLLAYQRKGKYYLFLETTSQLYRSLAPMQHWLFYFSESYHGSSKIFGVILSAAYLVSKCKDILSKVRAWKKAVGQLLQKVCYGITPSSDQMKCAGESCAICQDDYKTPTMLECKHIFCEECVSLWFDRERTCPMCRAQIADDPTWRDGSTTFLIQLF